MTTEEKAKAYDEALERARNVKHDIETIGCSMAPDMIEVIFPELRANEDERIRKALIRGLSEGLSEHNWQGFGGATIDECIAYLEKLKERPMPSSAELIKMWLQEEQMLREKDFRGDTWRIAQTAFIDGVAKGILVKQKETHPFK